jgi:hypothetical protein
MEVLVNQKAEMSALAHLDKFEDKFLGKEDSSNSNLPHEWEDVLVSLARSYQCDPLLMFDPAFEGGEVPPCGKCLCKCAGPEFCLCNVRVNPADIVHVEFIDYGPKHGIQGVQKLTLGLGIVVSLIISFMSYLICFF